MISPSKFLVLAAVSAFALGGGAWAQTTAPESSVYTPTVGQAGKDVVWVPTSQTLVDRMLDMAKLTAKDRLVDLGSGDGRMVISAAKRGATARGIEFNPELVAMSKRAAEAEGVARRATFEQADIFASDFSDATVVTLFLLPDLNLRLRPMLQAMKPGTRVVSNSFGMGEWTADEVARVGADCSTYCFAYKWVIPARVAGTWTLAGKELVLTQTFQTIQGEIRRGKTAQPVTDGRLDGTRISFSVGKDRYTGVVDGKEMRGKMNDKAAWSATLAGRGQRVSHSGR